MDSLTDAWLQTRIRMLLSLSLSLLLSLPLSLLLPLPLSLLLSLLLSLSLLLFLFEHIYMLEFHVVLTTTKPIAAMVVVVVTTVHQFQIVCVDDTRATIHVHSCMMPQALRVGHVHLPVHVHVHGIVEFDCHVLANHRQVLLCLLARAHVQVATTTTTTTAQDLLPFQPVVGRAVVGGESRTESHVAVIFITIVIFIFSFISIVISIVFGVVIFVAHAKIVGALRKIHSFLDSCA